MDLKLLLETSQYGNGILHGRLIDHDLLESSLKSSVLLDVLSVLVECCCTDAVELTSCQLRLEEVAGIHRALGPSCTDDVVDLVDEEDYLAVRLLNLIEDGLEPLLEFASELCARDK